MPVEIKPVVDSQDQVPEDFKDSYVEQNGKWVLSNPITVEPISAVAGLKSTLEKKKREVDTLAADLKKYADIDLDGYKKSLSELEDLRRSSGDIAKDRERIKAEHDKVISEIKAAHNKDIETRDQENQKLQHQLAENHIATEADKALSPLGGSAANVLRPHVLSKLIRVTDDTGKHTVAVADPDPAKQVRYSTKTGQLMTVVDLVAELGEHPDFKPLFPGSGMSGTGRDTTTVPRFAGSKVRVTQSDLSDSRRYRALKEEATKAGKSIEDYIEVVKE